WTALVAEINPEAVTVAEEWGDAADYLARTGFSSTMNYHAVAIPLDAFAFDGRIPAETFAAEVSARFDAFPEATRPALMNVLASHDTDRLASMIVNGRLGGGYDRLAGPRDTTAYLVRAPHKEERDLQRAVVLLQMGLPGAPHVYYGDEAGMWGADDPDDRKPMVWPDLAYETESRAPRGLVRDPDPVAFDATLFGFYQRAIALRHADPVLRRGGLSVLAASGDAVAFERRLGAERRVVAFNRAAAPRFLALPGEGVPSPLVPVVVSRDDAGAVPSLVAVIDDAEAGLTYGLQVPARTTVVYRPAEAADVRPRGLDE
ncbi:MAG: alpha-amylase family glycosyl hydrolase, partial [Bacteroidota bacterium]